MAYDNNNKGALFKNLKKREGKQDADYTGSIVVDGVEFWINAWLNESQQGQKYMGLSVTEKQAKVGQTQAGLKGDPFADDDGQSTADPF